MGILVPLREHYDNSDAIVVTVVRPVGVLWSLSLCESIALALRVYCGHCGRPVVIVVALWFYCGHCCAPEIVLWWHCGVALVSLWCHLVILWSLWCNSGHDTVG